jgi:hypothetical protein
MSGASISAACDRCDRFSIIAVYRFLRVLSVGIARAIDAYIGDICHICHSPLRVRNLTWPPNCSVSLKLENLLPARARAITPAVRARTAQWGEPL